jgi:hypothetical protein
VTADRADASDYVSDYVNGDVRKKGGRDPSRPGPPLHFRAYRTCRPGTPAPLYTRKGVRPLTPAAPRLRVEAGALVS